MLDVLFVVLIIFLAFILYYVFFSPTSQVFGKVFYEGETSQEKILALTFDDGPNDPSTSQILDILRKNEIKATFFPVGENIVRQKKLLEKIFNEGHIIGNHSYSHSFFLPVTSPNFSEEIARSQRLIKETVGKNPILFRPPWFFRQHSMLRSAKNAGLISITGTFASNREFFQANAKKIARDAIDHSYPGAILVFHDGRNNKTANRSATVEALEIAIKELKRDGYKFVTVPQLLNIDPYQQS